tara:strand:- start:2984 stop:4531 length:1548 start_codon:yes stop_codon:yes gene_type:complete
MNKKYLILLIIIFAIILYTCFRENKPKKIKENMASLSGSVYLSGDKITDLSLKQLKELPNIEDPIIQVFEDKFEEEEQIDEERPLDEIKPFVVQNLEPNWEGKKMPLKDIANLINRKLIECGVTNFRVGPTDVIGLKNRKRFLQLLPIIKNNIKQKITYDQIRCFITSYQPNNYINYAKQNNVIPKFLSYKNMAMINNYLYHFTPYGVIKYEVPVDSYVDTDDKVVVASLEATLIDDINKYNDSSFTIIPIKGQIYQIIDNKFYDIKTGNKSDINTFIQRMEDRIAKESLMNDVNEDEILLEEKNNIIDSPYYEEYVAYREKYYKLRNQVTEGEELDENSNVRIAKDIYNVDDENVNTDEMKENIVSLPEKFFSTILYLIYYDEIYFSVRPKLVTPNYGPMKKVNELIVKHDITLRGVLPHFYHGTDGQFHIEYLFLCNSNFYFIFKEGSVSNLMDFEKRYSFGFSKQLKYELSCQEHKIILDQLVSSNKITANRKNIILTSLKCFEDDNENIED